MVSSCSDPVIKKKINGHCVEVLHDEHALDLKVARRKERLFGGIRINVPRFPFREY